MGTMEMVVLSSYCANTIPSPPYLVTREMPYPPWPIVVPALPAYHGDAIPSSAVHGGTKPAQLLYYSDTIPAQHQAQLVTMVRLG